MQYLIRSVLVLTMVLGSFAFTLPAWAATLVVDDDGVQCPSAAFTSIQAAVNAASSGDTIRVCAGTYNETVNINKTLTMDGAGPGVEARRCEGTPAVNPLRESIVTGSGGNGFNLLANNITVMDFTFHNTSGAGVYTSPSFSGYFIDDNSFHHNTFGLYLNSDGASQTRVEDNCFLDNNKAGSASGNGIYSDQGLSNALIEDNKFRAQSNAGIAMVGGTGGTTTSQSNLTIRDNRLVNDSTISLYNTTNSVVTNNRSTNPLFSGIHIGGGVSDVDITRNRIELGQDNGILVKTGGSSGVTAPNTGLVIDRNRVIGNAVDGIVFENGDNSVVSRNRAKNNGRDGIRMEAPSTGNTIERNHADDNAEHDCHDDSTGSGTAGTANTWTRNSGDTENVAGLCD